MTVPNDTDAASRKAAVYRLYAADGTLLYIGSSYDPDRRCEAHHRTPWWRQVARRTDEWRRGPDGRITYVVHAHPVGGWWSAYVVSFGCGGPMVRSFEEIEHRARMTISKWTGRDYEDVAVRIRTAE